MTPEEIQRAMEFILQSHANNVVDIQMMKESIKENAESLRASIRESIRASAEESDRRLQARTERFERENDELKARMAASREDLDTLVRVSSNLLKATRATKIRTDRIYDELMPRLVQLIETNSARIDARMDRIDRSQQDDR
jgi:membrane-bound ClpP family serine protease